MLKCSMNQDTLVAQQPQDSSQKNPPEKVNTNILVCLYSLYSRKVLCRSRRRHVNFFMFHFTFVTKYTFGMITPLTIKQLAH